MPDGSTFFEPIPPPPPPPPEAPAYAVAWQPPKNVLGVDVPARGVLARTADTVIALTHVVAYPQGLLFSIHAAIRPGSGPTEPATPWGYASLGDGLRTGWLLADGTKVGSRFDEHPAHPFAQGETGHPLLTMAEGSEDHLHVARTYWLYPLPDGDTVTLVVAWPDRGIPETFHAMDLAGIRSAAQGCETFWDLPAPPDAERAGWFAYAPNSSAAYGSRLSLSRDAASVDHPDPDPDSAGGGDREGGAAS
jgi:hypothetical protein